jgi:hypothetical protein
MRSVVSKSVIIRGVTPYSLVPTFETYLLQPPSIVVFPSNQKVKASVPSDGCRLHSSTNVCLNGGETARGEEREVRKGGGVTFQGRYGRAFSPRP